MDSTIRLRQLNQAELSGFVSGVFNALNKVNVTGNLVSAASGLYNVGSALIPYAQVFANQLNITTGSGINFGNTSFRAYNSGGYAYVNVGGIIISSSGDNVFIQGPSGLAGPSGSQGPTGVSGIGITGISFNTSTNILTFSMSNHTSTSFNFQGLSGATGVSITGLFQSGNLIYPQFDHFKGTGAPFTLMAGPQGPPGSIFYFFEKSGTGVMPDGVNFPSQPIINPYFNNNVAPDIAMLRGMTYTADASGLATHTLTPTDITIMSLVFTGASIPFSAGQTINYFESGSNTGYWRFSFFDNSTPTGFYINNGFDPYNVFTESANNTATFFNMSDNPYRTQASFLAAFTAQPQYKYGFRTYTLGGENTSLDVILPSGFAYVLGNAFFSSGVGPAGPQGPAGVGIPGNQGPIGPSGQGIDGLSVVDYQERNLGPNNFQVQFIFSDGSTGAWIQLPTGGPSGSPGPSGLPGSILNVWSGVYQPNAIYDLNDTVSYFGSTYVYTGITTGSGIAPTTSGFWQLLALAGATGATGASGYADHYSVNFSVVSGFPTGVGTYANGITGITVNGTGLEGTNSTFKTGQVVSFRNSALIGYAYTPLQSILVASNSSTGTYFYASINSFDPISGVISFTPSGGTGIIGGGNPTYSNTNGFLWYNWGTGTINLGANIVSGAQGLQGIQGPPGPPGAISVMRNQVITGTTGQSFLLQPTGLNITGSSGTDIFNILITGNGNQYFGGNACNIDVNFSGLQTGQSIIIKIRNSGIPDGNSEPPLFYFSGVNTINASMIKWPNGQYSRPDNGQAYIYTILRFPDEFGQFSCYGTYSNPYF